ncbi:MAG: cell division protein ZapE [Denitrovibrio sp.]|nr:MAG: cell division protein ZapE [Denitrovibrio sp.]
MSAPEKYIDLHDISFDISVEDCFENLRPHPKFSHCTFENYIPDENFQTQAEIKERLQNTLEKMRDINVGTSAPISKRKFGLFGKKTTAAPMADENKPNNLYIDGSYGIGKTHLLSACYNKCQKNKAFLSFGEMNYFFHYLGVENCIQHFSKLNLLLIDEFELDDPAMTHIMAKFFREIDKNTLVVTTSNTLPSDLGKGRIGNIENFGKQLGIISDSFESIMVEGEDYRKKNKKLKKEMSEDNFLDAFGAYTSEGKPKSKIGFESLNTLLEANHPFKYFKIPATIEALFIDGLRPFVQLNNALRFNQLVDVCYYYNTKIFIKGSCDLSDLFPPELLESSFQKKLLRCLSRLDELAIFYQV